MTNEPKTDDRKWCYHERRVLAGECGDVAANCEGRTTMTNEAKSWTCLPELKNFGVVGPSFLYDQMRSVTFRHGFDCALISERLGAPSERVRAQRRLDRSSNVRRVKRRAELARRIVPLDSQMETKGTP
jgi:hypothetical protein